jgi:heme-degrading monooxygenase HmoA
MMISITTGKYTEEQARQSEIFLKDFLPQMRKFPGVNAIYHFAQPDKNEESTIVIWDSPEALKAYRESDLVKEAMAFEKKMGMPTTREAYPILSTF